MLPGYKHFDIHTQEPDWKFVAVLNGIASAGLGIISIQALPYLAKDHPWAAIAIFMLLPFWLVGVVGTIHFLVTIPLMKRLLPRKEKPDVES